MKFILASGSPRRLELLQQIGIEPQVMPSTFAEETQAQDPEILVQDNALGKGRAVADLQKEDAVVIAADTIVMADNTVLGKPGTKEEAEQMLSSLSGRKHKVLTGLAVFYQGRSKAVVETTDVEFYTLSPELIKAYIATGEPMDKAGAYGIQGKGALLVKRIQGSYSNVVGLPLGTLCELCKEMGVFTDGEQFNQKFSPR